MWGGGQVGEGTGTRVCLKKDLASGVVPDRRGSGEDYRESGGCLGVLCQAERVGNNICSRFLFLKRRYFQVKWRHRNGIMGISVREQASGKD